MNKKRDGTFLGAVIVLLGASGGIMRGLVDKTLADDQGNSDVTASPQDIFNILSPLFAAEDFDAAGQTLKQFAPARATAAVTTIIRGQQMALTENQKIALLLKTIQYADDEHRAMLWPLLFAYFPQQPVFYDAVMNGCADLIPLIMSMEDHKKMIQAWTLLSLQEAVKRDKPEVMDQLFAQGVRGDASVASPLLMAAVEGKKSVQFVPFLVGRLLADPNYSADGKKTVLIIAVEQNNAPMVQALLQEGADPQRMLNDTVGKPAQIAFERGFTDIERMIHQAIGQ